MFFDNNAPIDSEKNNAQLKKITNLSFAIFLSSAALLLGAGFVKMLMVNGTDLLSGKAAVEKFYRANLVKLILIALILVAFIIVAIKMWKGRETPIFQLAMNLVTLLMIVFYLVRTLLPVLNISKELKAPKTIELNSYTLCTNSEGTHFVAFNDDGAVLLTIPAEKYNELQKGKASNKKSAGQAHQLVTDRGYNDIQYYESELTVTYYNKSIIYENAVLNP